MSQVNCLYCGESIPDDAPRCPACNAVSHFQKRGFRYAARKRFVLAFTGLAFVVLVLAFWLPR